jgi:hypothetical protein
VANHLKSGDVMILDEYWLRLAGGGSKRCRENYLHPILPFYIVLCRDGSIVADEMFPDGKFTPLNIPELDQIGERVAPRDWWGRIAGGQGAKFFSPGDIAMIHELVRARLAPQERDIKTFSRLAGEAGGGADDGYLFRRIDDEGRPSLAIQSRQGFRVDVPGSSPLFAPLEARAPVTGELVKLLTRAAAGHEGLGLLTVEGNERALLQRRDVEGKSWLVALQGAARHDLKLTSGRPDPLGIERARWPREPYGAAGPAFAKAVADAAATGTWDEILLNAPESPAARAALGWHLGQPDWAVALVTETRERPAAGVQTGARVAGATIAARYKQWADRGTLCPGVRPSLETADDRRWLLDVLLAPREEWPKTFRANPLGLLAR